MAIDDTLNEHLKAAMRAHDKERVNCIRQVKSKLQEAVNQPDFSGKVDDALWQAVIGRYSKSLQKAATELRQGGARGEALTAAYTAEVDYLAQFLPKPASDADLAGWVQAAIDALQLRDPRMAGRVVGHVLKAHPGCAEPGRLKAVAEGVLAKAASDAS